MTNICLDISMKHLLLKISITLTASLFSVFVNASTYDVHTIMENPQLATRWQEDARALLYATVDGAEYLIAPTHPDWNQAYIEVKFEDDFDGDGLLDAVVSTSHGGNCCGPNYFVVSHRGEGFFAVYTHQDMTGWPSVSLNLDYGEKLLKVSNSSLGLKHPITEEQISFFRFAKGKLDRISYATNSAVVAALIEVTAQDVENDKKTINFDVDADGIEEEIVVSFWDRWQVATFGNIESSSMGSIGFSNGCSRIGFLSSMTNGVHDIVCDRNSILRYDLQSRRYQ